MKNNHPYLAFVIIALTLLSVSCGSENGNHQQAGEGLSDEQGVRKSLSKRYRAIVFPPKSVPTKKIFTYNLDRMLVNTDGRPVLFKGYLDDIYTDDDEIIVQFVTCLSDELWDDRRVFFRLKCKQEDIEPILANPPKWENFHEQWLLKEKDFLVVW